LSGDVFEDVLNDVRSRVTSAITRNRPPQSGQIDRSIANTRLSRSIYKQYRRLSFSVAPETLTETMKLNGSDYRGVAVFTDSPHRYFQTEATYEGRQGWGNLEGGRHSVQPSGDRAPERAAGSFQTTTCSRGSSPLPRCPRANSPPRGSPHHCRAVACSGTSSSENDRTCALPSRSTTPNEPDRE
jgi:hypothetical protein